MITIIKVIKLYTETKSIWFFVVVGVVIYQQIFTLKIKIGPTKQTKKPKLVDLIFWMLCTNRC